MSRPEGDPDRVGEALVPPPGREVPQRQRQDGGAEDRAHQQVALAFPPDRVLHEVQDDHLHQVHGHPREEVDEQAQEERAVLHRGRERGQDLRLLLRAVLAALARAEEHAQQRQRAREAEQAAHQQHARRVFRAEGADDHERHGEGHQARGDGEEHPVGREGRALVVVGGELGGEREVGHVHEGGPGVVEQVRDRVVDRERDRARERRPPPEHGEHRGERQRAEQQEGPAPAPAGARAVGEVPDERVVEVVPGAADEDRGRRHARGEAHHVGQEDGEVGADDGARQAEAGVARAVEQLGAPRQSLDHGGFYRAGRRARRQRPRLVARHGGVLSSRHADRQEEDHRLAAAPRAVRADAARRRGGPAREARGAALAAAGPGDARHRRPGAPRVRPEPRHRVQHRPQPARRAAAAAVHRRSTSSWSPWWCSTACSPASTSRPSSAGASPRSSAAGSATTSTASSARVASSTSCR